MAAAHPDVVARMEALLAREHQPSSAVPDRRDRRARRPATSAPEATAASGRAARRGGRARGRPRSAVTWGPEAIATSFRALWTADGLCRALRRDGPLAVAHAHAARRASSGTRRSSSSSSTSARPAASYAELEWNPVNAVVDLWVDRPENRYDKDWDIAGLESRRPPRGRTPPGEAIGWTATAFVPWSGARAKAPAGHGAAAAAGRPLALQRLPHRAAGRPDGAGEGRAVLLAVVAHREARASTCRRPSARSSSWERRRPARRRTEPRPESDRARARPAARRRRRDRPGRRRGLSRGEPPLDGLHVHGARLRSRCRGRACGSGRRPRRDRPRRPPPEPLPGRTARCRA